MQNYLSRKITIGDRSKKISSTWKLGIVLLGFGSIFSTFNSGAIAELEPPKSAALLAQASPNTEQQDIIIKVGVLSKEDRSRTISQWQPTMDYLSQTIPGYRFQIVAAGFEQMREIANNKEVNFFLVNPGMYVEFEADYGANRIATLKNLRVGKPYTQFGGLILTKADNNRINEIEDLKNKTFMAVSPTAFGGWYMAEGVLFEKGIKNPEKFFKSLTFGKTHNNVIKAIVNGEVEAGTVRTDALERAVQRGDVKIEDFKVINRQETPGFPFLHSTPLYPEWPFAAVEGENLELEENIAKALLNMPADSPAAQASKSAGWTVPLNYRPIHDLFIDLDVAPMMRSDRLRLRI